jgi:hypothetical protein
MFTIFEKAVRVVAWLGMPLPEEQRLLICVMGRPKSKPSTIEEHPCEVLSNVPILRGASLEIACLQTPIPADLDSTEVHSITQPGNQMWTGNSGSNQTGAK